ncbi:MAG: iron-containing alcohol dehydrogenase [Lentisphaerae bacterium]|nr:iron-containing alcohol dehydrogenase [Lentisphaerota bacterium]
MNNFDYKNETHIIFGRGTQSRVGELTKEQADKVLLHYGTGSIKRSGLYDEVIASLNEAGVEFVELSGVLPNPRVSLVRKGIEICRRENIRFILAVGGGSVIDSAKAIAMGVDSEDDIWDIFLQGKPTLEALKLGTILTLPATGSESSVNTVISNDEDERKVGYGAPPLRPVFSILNPELFFTLPKEQLTYGASDMMSHIFERYFTNTVNTDLTDALCEGALRTIMKNALILRDDFNNYDAWAEIGFSGYVAHKGLLGLGRDEDWACHAIEHELSAIYDVPHGAGLSVVTPSWMKYVMKENLPIFVQFAVKVMGVDGSFREQEKIALEGIRKLEEFYKAMGLPTTFKELGIEEDKIELMAKKATRIAFGQERQLGKLKKLSWQDVLKIYEGCCK